MILRNSLIFISQFLDNIKNQLRNIYLNSNFYNKKISKIYNKDLPILKDEINKLKYI